jgi:ribonuclease P protein component
MLLRTGQVRPATEAIGETSSAAIGRLGRRAEFIAMRGAARDDRPAFTLRARQRGSRNEMAGPEVRFGFTVTMKAGNAVERNRIRRRLREAVRRNRRDNMIPGCDYEVIGKRAVLATSFDAICGQLEKALSNVAKRMRLREGGALPASPAE